MIKPLCMLLIGALVNGCLLIVALAEDSGHAAADQQESLRLIERQDTCTCSNFILFYCNR